MIKLPKDFLANCPWKRELNAHFEIVKAETDAWVRSFGFLKDAESQDAFDRVQTPRLAALAYLHMNKDQLRTASDSIALLHVYDEDTDVADEKEAQRLDVIVLDSIHNPNKSRPAGENPLGELARQRLTVHFSRFWSRAIPHLSPSSQGHFLSTFEKYVDSVVVQTCDGRSGNERLLSFGEYWVIRQWNSACPACFALAELDLDMPDNVYRHAMLERLGMIAVQMIVASIGEVSACKAWGEDTLRQVEQYVDILGCWVRANEEWNFESHRYLGTDGPRVRRERTLVMMPKVDINPRALVGGGSCLGNDSERIRPLMEDTAVAGMQITTKSF